MSPRQTLIDSVRAYLARRRDALNEDVRHYPTPIARCDVQLTALLDARTEVLDLLRQDADAMLAGFAAAADRFEDAEAARLAAAVTSAQPASLSPRTT
jgi:hypothetical protein